jgi:VWFA-related protein
LDFVAETADHQPVLDLRADEIVLKEDGVLQPLKSFGEPAGYELRTRRQKSAHGAGAAAVLLDASGFLSPTMMRPAPGSPPGLDLPVSLNSDAEAVKSTAIKLIKNLSIESPVAAYVSNLDLRTIQDFAGGSDSRAIVKNSSADVNEALSTFDKMPILDPTKIHSIRIRGVEEFELAQIESIADHVANLPGRKTIIWYCDGFQPGPKFLDRINPSRDAWISMLTALQRTGTSLYPIDCFGQGMGGAWTPPRFGTFDSLNLPPPGRKFKQESMGTRVARLAGLTGGRYYRDYDRLSDAVHDALRDGRCSYEVAWKASNAANANPAHRIEMICKRKGVQLLYPHLYLDDALPQDEASRLKAVERGLVTPLDENEIPLAVHLRGAGDGASLVSVQFNAGSLPLGVQDGKARDLLDLVFAFYDAQGNRMEQGKHSTVRLALAPEDVSSFRQKEHSLQQQLPVPKEAKKLRVVLRDAASGAMGSATLPLP